MLTLRRRMGFDTPSAISEGGIRAIREGRTKYAPVSGREPLREVIRKSISRDHGRDYGIDQISVGCGAKQVSFNAPCASLDPGDHAVFPTSCWVSYPCTRRQAAGSRSLR